MYSGFEKFMIAKHRINSVYRVKLGRRTRLLVYITQVDSTYTQQPHHRWRYLPTYRFPPPPIYLIIN
jgi:hypothetical protein